MRSTESSVGGKIGAPDIFVAEGALFGEEKILVEAEIAERMTTAGNDRLEVILLADETGELAIFSFLGLRNRFVFIHPFDELLFLFGLRLFFRRTLNFFYRGHALYFGRELRKIGKFLAHETIKEFIKVRKESICKIR